MPPAPPKIPLKLEYPQLPHLEAIRQSYIDPTRCTLLSRQSLALEVILLLGVTILHDDITDKELCWKVSASLTLRKREE